MKCSRCSREEKPNRMHGIDHCIFEKATRTHHYLTYIADRFYLCDECYAEFLKFLKGGLVYSKEEISDLIEIWRKEK